MDWVARQMVDLFLDSIISHATSICCFLQCLYLLTCNTASGVGREDEKYWKNLFIVADSVPTTHQLLSYCIEIYCMLLGRWRATVACENKKKNKDEKERSAKIMSKDNILHA